jgi:glucose/arabinose dehydrogenase
MNPLDGKIWEHEHGPRGGDEINIINKGINYGWPVISYGINYNGTVFTEKTHQANMEQPLMYWLPSIGVCGMTFVKSDKYPGWENNLLSGSLRFQYLERAVIEEDKIVHQEKLFLGIGRLRVVEMGPDGYLYVGVEEPGHVFRLVPTKPAGKKKIMQRKKM